MKVLILKGMKKESLLLCEKVFRLFFLSLEMFIIRLQGGLDILETLVLLYEKSM